MLPTPRKPGHNHYTHMTREQKTSAELVDDAVTLTEQTAEELRALLHHITVGGGVHGNPYMDKAVKRAMQFLAIQDGVHYLNLRTEPRAAHVAIADSTKKFCTCGARMEDQTAHRLSMKTEPRS